MPSAPETRAFARPAAGGAVSLGVYAALSFLYFGRPIADHFGSQAIGTDTDPFIFTWAFAWWPHAIAHGLNPFYTHLVWAPGGINLVWTTSIPALSLLAVPLTVAASPVVSYNVVALLMPALAAWAAFLLCRRLTGRFWPSLAGGYLFGFSSYMLGQLQGHLNLTSAFVLPLVALLVLRRLDGAMGRTAFVGALGLLLAFEFAVSTELTFTLSVALVAAFALAFAFVRERREALASLVPSIGAAYLVAGVLVSPLLYFALTGFDSGSHGNPGLYPGDVLNLVVPTGLVEASGHWATHIAEQFRGNVGEEDGYLGAPVLVIAVWFFASRWRRGSTRFLAAAFVLAVVVYFGSGLHVEGRRVAPAPWALVHRLPLFNSVLPSRLAVYFSLVAAVVVALWAASSRASPVVRALLVAVAVLAQVPKVFGQAPWKLTPETPGFFAAGGAHTHCLPPGSNLLVLPYRTNDSLLWQPADGYRFRLAAPYLTGDVPRRFRKDATVTSLIFNHVPPGGATALLGFAANNDVAAIAVEQSQPEPWRRLLAPFVRPRAVDGVFLYPLGSRLSCR